MSGSRIRNGLQLGLSVSLSLAGCERSQPVSPPVESRSSPVRPEASRSAPRAAMTLDKRLARGAVYNDRVARRVLYTWTTKEQMSRLREEQILLTRKRSPTHGLARFDRTIRQADGPIERLLQKSGWDRRRFAWPNAWATLGGWEGESYGYQLVRVELRAEASIAIYHAYTDEPWTFTRVNGEPVSQEWILAHPETLAAVFHVSDKEMDGMGSFASISRFREYVIVNEAMVEEWSIGTSEIAGEIQRGSDLVEEFRQYVARAPTSSALSLFDWGRHVGSNVWPASVQVPSTNWLYEANLAMPNSVYQPTNQTILRLLKWLQVASGVQGESLVHRPDPTRIRDFWQRRADAVKPDDTPNSNRNSTSSGPSPSGTF